MLEQRTLTEKILEEFDLYIPIVAENEYRAYYEIQFSLQTDKRCVEGILKTNKMACNFDYSFFYYKLCGSIKNTINMNQENEKLFFFVEKAFVNAK